MNEDAGAGMAEREREPTPVADHASPLTRAQAVHFRDLLRDARMVILRDSEAFEAVVRVLEQLAALLNSGPIGLHNAEPCLRRVALASPLAEALPRDDPSHHLAFGCLFHSVRRARNAAVHEGAYARRMASQVIELALIMEDALSQQLTTFAELMVRNPVTAQPWHPLSLVRQTMLANSFSYLPLAVPDYRGGAWRVVSDVNMARYLGVAASKKEREQRLSMAINDAIKLSRVKTSKPVVVRASDLVRHHIDAMTAVPILVVDGRELLGIVTAFDML